ncbi:MAG: hypothetical protein KBG75_08885 [Pseudomonadales bacterium]|nr:hypothetical protein [Pseudomonadales bacterium]
MRVFCLMLTLLLGACAGGSSSGDAGGTAYQATYDAQLADKTRFGRIVIAPMNFGKPSRGYLSEHDARIDAMIEKRLHKAGYEILPGTLFDEAWREGVRKWGEPYNPTTGKLNDTSYQYVLSEAVRWLEANSQVQAVMFTNLEEQQIYFSPSGSHATHFLGVTRKPSSRGGEGVPADFDWIQAVDAVGIYVNVFDLKLQRLFNGAGGIEVTEVLDLKGSKPVWKRQKKVLDNDSFIEEGLNLALQPWLRPE